MDLWRYYIAEDMPRAGWWLLPQTFLTLLFSASTHSVEVLEDTSPGQGLLYFYVRGECFDGLSGFEYCIDRRQFDKDEKYRILGLVKESYPATKEPSRATPRKAAKAMGILYK